MNIGFDAKRLFNNFTGLGNYSRTLISNLVKYFPDNNYTLYTTGIRKNKETDIFLNNNKLNVFVTKKRNKGYWRSFSILKQLKKDNIELYHGLSHEIPFGILRKGIKSVVTVHDLIFKIYPKTYSFIDRQIYNYKFRYSCKFADKIIAISESTKWDIINLFNIEPHKIEVIYQSCNTVFKKCKSEDEINTILKEYEIPDKFLLYVGSVIERKNLITIIESYIFLPKELQIPMVIIGKGKHYKNRLKKRAEKLKIAEKIIWIENMDNNDHLQAFYQKASIFIYPSVYEGFGIPIIEAILCKTPVITSNTSSLPEAGGPASWYIDPLNAKQMASGIKKILTDKNFRKQMIDESYEYVLNTFNEEKITGKLHTLYEKTLKA